MQRKIECDWNQSYVGDASDYTEPDADLLSIIDGLEPGQALDLGCGAGGLLVALARKGWIVTGIDIAEKAIESARIITQDRGVNAELHVADVTTWKPRGYYDLIASSFALPADRAGRNSVFQLVQKALAPRGTVLLKDFDSTMNRVEFFAEMDLVTVEELTKLFDGFNIVRAEIVPTPVHHHGSGNYKEDWTAVLFQARGK